MNLIKMPTGGTRTLLKSFSANVDMRLDEACLAEGTASNVSGFDVTDGALTDGYGLTVGAFGTYTGEYATEWTRYDSDDEEYKTCKIFCDEVGYTYYNYGNGWTLLGGIFFHSVPTTVPYRVNGTDCLLFTSAKDGMYVWDGNDENISQVSSPNMTSVAMHYERMFATSAGEQNTVYFSDDLNPTNWDTASLEAGGFIQLLDERGKALKVLDFLNYVYVFREYGISRITAYADQEDFRVTNLYVSGGKIYEGSVCTCGDTIIMLCSDGLHAFDGYNVSDLLKRVKFLPSTGASAVYSNGKYYLSACTKNVGSNDTLLVYDLSRNTFTLSPIAIKSLYVVGEDVYGITNDGKIGKVEKCGAVFGTPITKVWESGEITYPDGAKTLSYVTMRSEGKVTLTVIADGVEHSFNVSGDIRIKPMTAGKVFKFRITSNAVGARVVCLSYKVRN